MKLRKLDRFDEEAAREGNALRSQSGRTCRAHAAQCRRARYGHDRVLFVITTDGQRRMIVQKDPDDDEGRAA